MNQDLFTFWSKLPMDMKVHPADEAVLDRVSTRFELECLPTPFTGPLRTAGVVLLFLAPGFDQWDIGHALTEAAQVYNERSRSGDHPFHRRKSMHAPSAGARGFSVPSASTTSR